MGDTTPIAVIGMGCRFSGDVDCPEKLWKMCAEGRSGWSSIPQSRFNIDGVYHRHNDKAGTLNVVGGHFLEQDPAVFDGGFFSLSYEAVTNMDPQFRMQLETTYEALESAGLTLQNVAGSDTSVFSGAFFHDYADSFLRDPDTLPRLFLLGVGGAMAANRISHFYDFRGPSLTIDTGCSTSLTALHQACQSLQARESSMSVVSGANLMLNPDMFAVMSSLTQVPAMKLLSADGRSFAFDSRANGYGRGEGSATIVLKRLDDAVRDGNPIRAVIRGSAVNQDGRTETITSPSLAAQQKLIKECYRKAGLDPLLTTYVEAHGTGTPTGDPIEARAIASVFREEGVSPVERPPLPLGSVKTNIGHTETASGLASVIKVVLALENKQIPPNQNFQKPNPNLDLEKMRLKVPTELQSWPDVDGVRRASINSFGYGGTNAHVIMEDHASFIASFNPAEKEKNESRLLDNLAFTLGQRRTRFQWSASLQARCVSDLLSSLDSKRTIPSKKSESPRLGFVFTGQGAQWGGMGRELVENYPAFKSSLLESAQTLKEFGCPWDLVEELMRDTSSSRINEGSISMPACVATQIALVQLLKSWGIICTAVASHSSGEIAASYASGAISKIEALAIAYSRGKFVMSGKGSMTAVALGPSDAQEYIKHLVSGKLIVACMNSPTSTTISGDVPALEELEDILKDRGVFTRRLKIDNAYHSHQMEQFRNPYEDWIARNLDLSHHGATQDSDNDKPTVAFFSPTTGGRVSSIEALREPSHWGKGMVSPVRFVEAFQGMCRLDSESPLQRGGSAGVDMIVEVGPHGALGGPIQEILGLQEFQSFKIPYGTCLVRGSNAVHTMHKLVCSLLDEGYAVDLGAVNFPLGHSSVQVLHDLPHYPWNHRTRYWSEPRCNKSLKQREHGYHDLLGYLIPGTDPKNPSWKIFINESDLPWVRDHIVQSNMVYPGAGLIVMAVEAALQSCNPGIRKISGYALKDVKILQALVIPAGTAGIEVQIALQNHTDGTASTSGWKVFTIHGIEDNNTWTTICKGRICVHFSDGQAQHNNDNGMRAAAAQLAPCLQPESYRMRLSPTSLYANLRAAGIVHGQSFQNITSIRAGRKQSLSTLSVTNAAAAMPHQDLHEHVIHPTTLDGIIQTAYPALKLARSPMRQEMIPKSIDSMWIAHDISKLPGSHLQSYSYSHHEGEKTARMSVLVYDDMVTNAAKVRPLVEITGLVLQSLGTTSAESASREATERYCAPRWVPDLTLMPVASLRADLGIPVPANELDVMTLLRKASLFFVQDALKQLNAEDVSKLANHFIKYYAWMKTQLQLAQDSALGNQSSDWDGCSRDERDTIIEQVGRLSVVGETICRLGPNIPALLRGEITPLELLLKDELLERYYSESPKLRRSYQQLGQLIRHYAHKNPRARILEIGAGTGATTAVALAALEADGLGARRMVSSYDFTDVSPGFFEAAMAKFSGWKDLLRFKKLNIEQDPADQGFEANAYDLVIASQVLHATKSMKNTMLNIHRLLKPGGMLFMIETTQDQMDLHFTFGLLPEWWAGGEDDRISTPHLSIDSWNALLQSVGFNGVDIEVHDCQDEALYSFSVMSSTAVEQVPKEPPTIDIVLVFSHSGSAPTEWIERMRTAVYNTMGQLPSVQTLQTVEPQGKICIYLGDLENPALLEPDIATWQNLKLMCTHSQSLLWVTRGGAFQCEHVNLALSSGFLRSVRTEFAGKRLYSFDIDPSRGIWSLENIVHLETIIKRFLTSSNTKECDDFEYAERHGIIHTLRYFTDVEMDQSESSTPSQETPCPDRSFRACIETPGLLNTLSFKCGHGMPVDLPSDYLEIEPKAFGVNFRDVMVAMGQLPSESALGFECAGVVIRAGTEAFAHGFRPGDHVAALLRGNFASLIRTRWTSAVKMAEGLTFETAASMPMVFATAYISLFDAGHLEKGDRVLIHAATGGVGQAAIILAKNAGAEIFATVGTEEKRSFLVAKYGIPRDHIFSSRGASFSDAVLAATRGQGVDVIVNSLSGALLEEGFNCLARFGRFVEIGKRDIEVNSALGMSIFGGSTTFTHVDLMQLQEYKGAQLQRVLKEVMRLYSQRQIEPVQPVTVYPLGQLEKMFRLMQAGKHMGKIVAKVEMEETDVVPTRQTTVSLRRDASYIVVGGSGGIGQCISEWLAEQGAKSVIVLSRSAKSVKNVATFEADMAALGCNLHLFECDISVRDDLARVLEDCCASLPPIHGVIHAGMVLQDSVLERMNLADYHAAVRPKVAGSWNLHELLNGAELQFFIMLSSLTGIFGSSSQSNYAAGGTFQDALATHRTSRGLPGVSIDLSVVDSIGYAAEHEGVAERLSKIGYQVLSEEHVLEAVGRAIISPFCGQLLVGINTSPGPHWSEESNSSMGRDRRFAALQITDLAKGTSGNASGGSSPEGPASDVGLAIAQAGTVEEAESAVVEAICRKVCNMFVIEEPIDVHVPLAQYGVDSLVAVEMRNMLALVAGAEMSVFDIIQSPSISSLGSAVALKSKHLDARLLEGTCKVTEANT